MKYQVLARRYRPRKFEEVVGQEAVAATLRAAIQQERLAHAYLFTGPRGVGKTSMARIFAKALNCPQAADQARPRSQWGDPCDRCPACEAIHLGQDIDVVELDGASHRGIEDIRSIVESVNRPATRSIFKIYIIDEVHMLTREAFNALLKTLEEPPGHVKFIFATTEPHRIPETVLSRCQRFDFHPIDEEAIVRRLSQILALEGRTAEEGLLAKIARCAKGGLRDAQTLLDQLMTFVEGALRVEDLERMTGRVPEATAAGLLDAVLEGDCGAVLHRLQGCFEEGADPALLLEQVIDGLRARIRRLVDEAAQGAAGRQPPGATLLDRLIGSLQVLLEAAAKLKFSPQAEASVEVSLLKVARLESPAALEEVIRSLHEIERRGRGPGAPAPAQAIPAGRLTRPPAAAPPEAPAGDFRLLLSVWGQVGVELEAKYPDIAPYFKDTVPAPVEGKPGVFRLEIRDPFCFRQLRLPGKLASFLAVLREVAGASWQVQLASAGKLVDSAVPSGAAPADPSVAGSAAGSLPASPTARAGEAARPREHPGAGGISSSALVKKSLELFNGRMV